MHKIGICRESVIPNAVSPSVLSFFYYCQLTGSWNKFEPCFPEYKSLVHLSHFSSSLEHSCQEKQEWQKRHSPTKLGFDQTKQTGKLMLSEQRAEMQSGSFHFSRKGFSRNKNYSNSMGLVGQVGILELKWAAGSEVRYKHFLPAIVLNIHWFIFTKIFRYKCYIKLDVIHVAERPHLLITGFDSAANEVSLDGQAKATSFICQWSPAARTIISQF